MRSMYAIVWDPPPEINIQSLKGDLKLSFTQIGATLQLENMQVFSNGKDVHLVWKLKTGEYFQLRSWIQHMLDCTSHQEIVLSWKIFIGGYIRDQFETTTHISPETWMEATYFWKTFFHYGWFENNPYMLAELIQKSQPRYFWNQGKTITTSIREKTKSIIWE